MATEKEAIKLSGLEELKQLEEKKIAFLYFYGWVFIANFLPALQPESQGEGLG